MSSSCALIGLGAIGMGYDLALAPEKIYTHARAFSSHPAFVLAGATDPSAERSGLFEARYGKPTYPGVRELMESLAPSVVVIATPTATHYSVLKEVLQHGLPKLILCEKPLSTSLEAAREMVRLCEECGVPLFVNYPRRSDPGALQVMERIRSGAIATPVKSVTWYSKGLFNNGSHLINLLELWLGHHQQAAALPGPVLFTQDDPEPDAFVTFERGRAVLLSAREEDYSHYAIELVSPSGRLRYERGGEHVTWEAAEPDPVFRSSRMLSDSAEMIPNGRDRYQWHVADQLARALAGEPAALCDGLQALQTLECIHSILQSNP